MEISDAVAQNLFGFISALIGAVVGGFFTLRATDKAISEENAKENRQEEKEVQNLLDALGVEIEALWGFHMKRIGERVEQRRGGDSKRLSRRPAGVGGIPGAVLHAGAAGDQLRHQDVCGRSVGGRGERPGLRHRHEPEGHSSRK